MTVLTMANLLSHSTAAVSWDDWRYNISIVTLGNAFAGVATMGAAYWDISASDKLEPLGGSSARPNFSSAAAD